MKVEIVSPPDPLPEVVITLTIEEARQLRSALTTRFYPPGLYQKLDRLLSA